MRRPLRRVFVLGALSSFGLAYACLGDDPGAGPTSFPDAAASGETGPTADGASATDSAAVDAPLVCDAPAVACGDTCAVLATSKDHCGRCGHSCGGGECAQGSCKSVPVATDIQELGGLSVSDGYAYFSTNNADQSTAGVLRCAVTGCAPKETLFNSQILGSDIGTVTASQGLVTFRYTKTAAAGIVQVCPAAGCPAGGSTGISGANSEVFATSGKKFYIAGGKFSSSVTLRDCSQDPCTSVGFGPGYPSGGAGDDTHVIFAHDLTDGGSELALCDVPSACDAGPVGITTTLPDQGIIHAGVFYTLKIGISGLPSGRIAKCALPCTGGPVNFIGPLNYPTELAVDASGIYWIAPNLDQILTCPLAGCTGAGPSVVMEGLGPSPTFLRTDSGFVYWTADATDGGVSKRNVLRIAKP